MVRLAGAVALCALLAAPHYAAADADALWYIVSEQCVPDQQQFHSPKPCDQVDLAAGYVVLKDRVGDTQFLLMPTARITGIESPEILAPDAPNYWNAAWQARHFVDERAHRTMPRETISLAINSPTRARRISCISTSIACVSTCRRHCANTPATSAPTWAPFPVKLSGHDYMAMRIDQPELGDANPFVLLADGIPGARADMAHYTLVVVGDPGGFVLLAGARQIGRRGVAGPRLRRRALILGRPSCS